MSARPMALVSVSSPGTICDEYGEVIMERKRTRLVRAFSKSVEQCVGTGAPYCRFQLSANKHGQVLSALGPITIQSVDMAYPGCETSDEIRAADHALNMAGATRGNSPAGRALDWTMRENKEIAQWRVKSPLMDVFTQALYGGVQFGGEIKPNPKANRVTMDIISSYPFMAMQPLPRVRDGVIERGLRPNAVLVLVAAQQSDRALFSRTERGGTEYQEDFYGWYTLEELDYHVACGRVKISSVVKSLTFSHSEKYLAPSVEHFFTQREKYPRGTPERGVIKSALNGLLGKFASPISTWRSPKPLEMDYAIKKRNATTLQLGQSELINDITLANIYPRNSNVIWTVVTYARARVRLWQKMDEITKAGGKVLWVHTDCVIADVPPSLRMQDGNALGDWRIIHDE